MMTPAERAEEKKGQMFDAIATCFKEITALVVKGRELLEKEADRQEASRARR